MAKKKSSTTSRAMHKMMAKDQYGGKFGRKVLRNAIKQAKRGYKPQQEAPAND